MSEVLAEAELQQALGRLPGWGGDAAGITRSVKAPAWLTGIRLVEEVAAVAEAMDHHPDIDIRWRTLTFTLSTHSAGGVTAKDVELASRIDEIAERLGAG